MRSMSTTALVNLVRRVEASQGLARLASASHRGPARTQQTPAPSPALPEHTRVEVGAVVGEMQAAAHAHTHHDSDATETSSGGESCDELEGFPDTNTNYTPVTLRNLNISSSCFPWLVSQEESEVHVARLSCPASSGGQRGKGGSRES
ncbi:hypothetical protein E2C01_021271 [Portunus trituberculatus]|uniref:Uncharacterized protein n=1 Tax=Portunus trituberculatus TaxID=210409 RepID=A0A5B7E404_PORTR|nr:hypothetical protein [Portunus trituberculatus]